MEKDNTEASLSLLWLNNFEALMNFLEKYYDQIYPPHYIWYIYELNMAHLELRPGSNLGEFIISISSFFSLTQPFFKSFLSQVVHNKYFIRSAWSIE